MAHLTLSNSALHCLNNMQMRFPAQNMHLSHNPKSCVPNIVSQKKVKFIKLHASWYEELVLVPLDGDKRENDLVKLKQKPWQRGS